MSKSGFRYRPRTQEAIAKRAEDRSGSLFDRPIKSQFKTFVPKDGENTVRILPPTWDLNASGYSDAPHWGYSVFMHYGVGPDEQSYLCPWKVQGRQCPLCDERAALARDDGDDASIKRLRPSERMGVWCINRDDEAAGALLWLMPMTVNNDIERRSYGKRVGDTLYVDDPEEGYDVSFHKSGKAVKTNYDAIDIDRRHSPIFDDAKKQEQVLEFIAANPVPACLQVFSGEHISAVYSGVGKRGGEPESVEPDYSAPTSDWYDTQPPPPAPTQVRRGEPESAEPDYSAPTSDWSVDPEQQDEIRRATMPEEELEQEINKAVQQDEEDLSRRAVLRRAGRKRQDEYDAPPPPPAPTQVRRQPERAGTKAQIQRAFAQREQRRSSGDRR